MDLSCLDSASCGEREFHVAWAMKTLAHESFHMRGIGLENAAEYMTPVCHNGGPLDLHPFSLAWP